MMYERDDEDEQDDLPPRPVSPDGIEVRSRIDTDGPWIRQLLTQSWGSPLVVSRGRAQRADQCPAVVALLHGERAGLATYRTEGAVCEILTLNSAVEGKGVGKRLLEGVEREAREAGCRRVWLVTTNDNLEALRFYQKRGYVITAVHRNAVQRARSLKPVIPAIGRHGIPVRDEIELEKRWSAEELPPSASQPSS